MELKNYSKDQLASLEIEFSRRFEEFRSANLKLDMTRGKPAPDQLDLANGLDGCLAGKYFLEDKTDLRNYGGLDGIAPAKKLFAPLLGVKENEVLIGGNSSLELMYRYMLSAHFYGIRGPETAWMKNGTAKFLCPSPGYDRHFTICEDLGIQMIPVRFTSAGPDMDQIEELVRSDKQIRGIWCVPKYSNPTGHVYSESTVNRIAALGKIAGPLFRVMWDNAYAIHDLYEPIELANIMEAARRSGTEDNIVIFGSTSKVTFAGAGLAFMASSEANLKSLQKRLSVSSIGPDKVNQQRHVVFLKDLDNLRRLMGQHASLLRPKFEVVLKRLAEGLEGKEIAWWTKPRGGYFISLDVFPGTAREVIRLAGEAGVKLSPAGSFHPYSQDPNDSQIRISPSFPKLDELDMATQVLVSCVQLAAARKLLR